MDVIVIGAGYWGQNYIRELGGNLVGVIEPDKERAEYIVGTYNVNVFPPEDFDELGFDGAVIATPPANHMFYAQKLLKQGKYVYVPSQPLTSASTLLLTFITALLTGILVAFQSRFALLGPIRAITLTPDN